VPDRRKKLGYDWCYALNDEQEEREEEEQEPDSDKDKA
jgi:hypothetical protein